MKSYRFISLVVLAFGLASCFKPTTETPASADPVIDSLTVHYSQLNKSIFIAADIYDPQGIDDIDSVSFTLSRLASEASQTGTPILTGCLSDDGPPEDIICRDGLFSFLVDSAIFGNRNGYYKVDVIAYDTDGNESETVSQKTKVEQNTAPSIFMLSAPTNFEKGDTLKFRIRATDPQGPDDIISVSYGIRRPNGEYSEDWTWTLRDDGLWGDDHADDGIYTVFQPSSAQSKYQGLFTFYFFAKDAKGALSDTLKASITNPGVTINFPNLQENISIGDTLTILWESAYISSLQLAYTLNASASDPTFTNIAVVTATTGIYKWKIPSGLQSSDCRIKAYDTSKSSRYDISDNSFTIQ
ncbi:MAG: hypothetical protein COT43_02365 [Candidatus Marinimicrobia bacterium CG08_land_8_20_14_0_20_45_22]|nr:MAG: hypothetical protein COT43_02365 [Candidatus Marinimicrobia bacterium CG08_land_8_20_14_0_20_45_22]